MPPPTLSVAAQLSILRELATHPTVEHIFACEFDHDTQVLTRARFLLRGRWDSVSVNLAAFTSGQICLHNHPNGRLVPSNADMDVAAVLAVRGVGSALFAGINLDRLFLLAPPARPAPIVKPAVAAPPASRLPAVEPGSQHVIYYGPPPRPRPANVDGAGWFRGTGPLDLLSLTHGGALQC